MSPHRSRNGILAAVVAALLSFGVMYALGAARAPGDADATLARQTAFHASQERAKRTSFTAARAEARSLGLRQGTRAGRRAGRHAGTRRGTAKRRALDRKRAEAAAAASAAQQAAQAPPLVTLPNGEPGYALPPDQRTLSCVGIDASSGHCIGD